MYYFDSKGWLTTEVLPDRATSVAPATQTPPEGYGYNFTGYTWVLQPLVQPIAPAPVVIADLRLTKRAFQARFPKSSDGISTKYDLMTLFLMDDGYAGTLSVGAALYPLRALIITGKNRLDASACVDLNTTDAAGFCMLLQSSSIPSVFRLTAAETAVILSSSIAEAEKYHS